MYLMLITLAWSFKQLFPSQKTVDQPDLEDLEITMPETKRHLFRDVYLSP